MRTGLTKQEKTTDIWFDEKDPLIHIRTHNTDLKNRLTAYSRRFPSVCKLTDSDPETGCMEFEIAKGRFSFRLTAPYSEERRQAASDYAKKHGISAGKSNQCKKDIMGDKTVRVRADLHHIIKIETAKNGGNVKEVMEIRLRSKLKSVLIVHYLKILYNRN